MELVRGSERIIAGADTSPAEGVVKWAPVKSIWIGSMTGVALIFGPLTFSWDAFAVFLVLCAITLCGGHSVGCTGGSFTEVSNVRCGSSMCW